MRRIKLSPSTFFKLFIAAVTLALGLAAASLWPQRSDTPSAPPVTVAPARAEVSVRDTFKETEKDAVFEGTYVNYVYGYSVEIPAGMVGVGSTPPAPQHGFGIDLDHPRSTAWNGRPDFPKSYLYVDGSYNSAEWRWLDQAAGSRLDFLSEKGRRVRVQSRAETSLGGLPALRVVARYEEDGVEMVSDEIVAFRKEDGKAWAVHTLALSTPLSKYERDRPALEALRMLWCLQPPE